MNAEIKDKIAKDFILKYKETIKSLYAPSGVWLFGSRAGGQPKEESDLDLIVVSEKFKGIKFIHRMGLFLKNFDFPKHIDALCYTPEEFKKKESEIGLVSEALAKGTKIL